MAILMSCSKNFFNEIKYVRNVKVFHDFSMLYLFNNVLQHLYLASLIKYLQSIVNIYEEKKKPSGMNKQCKVIN